MNHASRAIFIFLFLTCTGAAVAVVAAQTSAGVISLESDLDGDGRPEHIRLDKESDPALSIRSGRRAVWQGVPARWKPWKLLVADVDGDGRREVVVGVYKATRFFPRPHNCLFIYSWDGQRAHPKWLGSSLSRPFLDFAFMDVDGDREEELVAIEMKRDRRLCVALYSWNGFGYTLDWQRGDWQELRLIGATRDAIILEADNVRVTVTRNDMRNTS